MKAFIAYTLIAIGVPVFVGLIIGGALTMPMIWFLHGKANFRLPNMLYLESVHGFVASVAGAFIFRLFGLTAGFAVPAIIAAWVTFYFFAYNQPKRAWASWLAGLFIGWFTLAKTIIAA
jgi:hypothetical protein